MLAVSVLVLAVPGVLTAQTPTSVLAWQEDLDAAFSQARTQNKKLLIHVYAPWNAYHLVMQQGSYADAGVQRLVNEHYVPVLLNAERTDSLLFQGQRYGYLPARRMHELASVLLEEKPSYPATVVITPQGQILSPVAGYLDAPTLFKVLKYYASGAYATTPWQDYKP